eukprot:GFYU01000803.1.p1 GENE.GFYU01000803.1~~GFYU01000803.1.p1  ORF type:complete len:385 (+),score=88.50 GFYU01000803.1:285-1439(+)
MVTLTEALTPSKGVGQFLLGLPISQAISYLQQNKKTTPRVEFLYSEENPLDGDMVMTLPDHGMRLRFEPVSQRLRLIEIFDVCKIRLSYSNKHFSGPSVPCTSVTIYQLFGPTYPGEYDASARSYLLHYPGLTFVFDIPEQYEHLYVDGTELPLEFPNGESPLATKIYVYHGTSLREPVVPTLPQHEYYFEEVHVSLGEGITFCGRERVLYFDSSEQDVLTELGPPSKVFYKEEDKMRIHASDVDTAGGMTDYFYNYFDLGVDILFDAHMHTVKKFTLHTNFPGHTEFNQYAKCNFKIFLANDEDKDESEDGDETEGEPIVFDSNTKWDEISKMLGTAGRPMINNKGSMTNPFGATLFYGYKNIIFEVLKNNHLAGITLYKYQP